MKKVERVVRELIDKHGTNDPFVIAKNEGIKVRPHELEGVRGYFINPYGQPIIGYNPGLSRNAITFSVGHELGHFVFDIGLNRAFMDYYTHVVVNKYENRADVFSATLMLGQPPLYQDSTYDIHQMADMLNVPEQKVHDRMIQLELFWR